MNVEMAAARLEAIGNPAPLELHRILVRAAAEVLPAGRGRTALSPIVGGAACCQSAA